MPAGRRSTIDEFGPKFLAEIENALPIKAAAARAGLHIYTAMDWLARWRKEKTGKYAEFLEQYTRARGIAQAKMIDREQVALAGSVLSCSVRLGGNPMSGKFVIAK